MHAEAWTQEAEAGFKTARPQASVPNSLFFFLISVGCPGQLTRITTIPHGPLNILQAQWASKAPRGWQGAHRGSNPGRGRNKSHDWPQRLGPQVPNSLLLLVLVVVFILFFKVTKYLLNYNYDIQLIFNTIMI